MLTHFHFFLSYPPLIAQDPFMQSELCIFNYVKLKYKQKANLSDGRFIRLWTMVALQKIHEHNIKLIIIKVQLKLNETN